MRALLLFLVGCGSGFTPLTDVTLCHDGTNCDTTETSGTGPEICNDGVDNDGDWAVDCQDPDCDGQCPEQCADTRDNDNDGLIDCADPDCFGPACTEICGDSFDNDGDGFTDCADSDCNDPSCPEVCNDLADNDGDGLIDCLDDDCNGVCPEDQACEDGWDNDGDGLTDCDDPDCYGPLCGEACTDAIDNDSDGLVDCDDSDCQAECDADGDGYFRADYGYDDCDDSNPGINPGAAEICDDGIDQDCSGGDESCSPTYVGQYKVDDGPPWANNPVTSSCLDVCAQLFGGAAISYQCSTNALAMNNLAYSSTWGIGGCGLVAEGYKLNTFYNCGFTGCATSSFVTDNCLNATNFCWQ